MLWQPVLVRLILAPVIAAVNMFLRQRVSAMAAGQRH
nr:MAG TPA: hypothetical protein [Caudoviricetes sp.]